MLNEKSQPIIGTISISLCEIRSRKDVLRLQEICFSFIYPIWFRISPENKESFITASSSSSSSEINLDPGFLEISYPSRLTKSSGLIECSMRSQAENSPKAITSVLSLSSNISLSLHISFIGWNFPNPELISSYLE